ncbi:hypothetical protein AVEN_102837-1 [Araneus ventricosus]|uniref:Uncharacterized protein n=1 Tax=Araneus ventricosus TaxID=182803 RepID=A0A4Y2SFL5_ARAVE|nr:hypothetical protein AVEN_269384-1 [Araneus ventricosus]GBO38031.1 hypothetical protein AVEN_102837-1 [Araneus ventricosus]
MNLMSYHIHNCFISNAICVRWRIITPQDSLWSSLRKNTHRNGNLRLIENASRRDESEVKGERASKGQHTERILLCDVDTAALLFVGVVEA